MAITQAVCNSFKRELFEGVHDFTVARDYKLALYTSTATINASTTAYTATNEVVGTGYTALGADCVEAAPTLSGATVILDFTNTVTWSTATFTARGSLLYVDSLAGNNAVCVNDFGSDKTASGGDFVVNFPTPDASNAILRLT